jgi:hypothetical protein
VKRSPQIAAPGSFCNGQPARPCRRQLGHSACGIPCIRRGDAGPGDRTIRKPVAIEAIQARRTPLPVEILHRETARISSKSDRKIIVSKNFGYAIGNFCCIAAMQQESVDAVPQAEPEIRGR